MRVDHIVSINEHFQASVEATEETIVILDRQMSRLTCTRDEIDRILPVLSLQKRQLEQARQAFAQLAATNGAPLKETAAEAAEVANRSRIGKALFRLRRQEEKEQNPDLGFNLEPEGEAEPQEPYGPPAPPQPAAAAGDRVAAE